MNLLNPIAIADAAGGAAGGGIWLIVLYIVVIGGAMYFLMIRPQKKKQKNEAKMRDNAQVGDEIISIGGISGRIVSIKDDSFVLESPIDHTKIKIAKWAIQTNNTVHDEKQ